MANGNPPRPGGPPPRPGSRPGGMRAKPGGSGRAGSRPQAKPPVGGQQSWAPPPDAAPRATPAPRSAPEPEDLRMVPLTEADAADADAVSQPKSSTQFFAIPQAKRKSVPVDEPAGPAPGGPPPGQAPGMAPPGGGMAPGMGIGVGMGMGIQGPVAGGPVSMAPAPGHPQQAMLMQDGAGMDGNRAQSYRVFVIVAALMFMVFTALILTVGMTVGSIYMTRNAEQQAATAQPTPAPKNTKGQTVDTGVQLPAAGRCRFPLPTGGTNPSPGPKRTGPAPAPAPPPAPVNAPGAVSVTIPSSANFTSIEVKCPDGFRQRGSFAGGTATVPAVPAMECDVIFKGGLPAQNKIRGGQSLTCAFQGSDLTCN